MGSDHKQMIQWNWIGHAWAAALWVNYVRMFCFCRSHNIACLCFPNQWVVFSQEIIMALEVIYDWVQHIIMPIAIVFGIEFCTCSQTGLDRMVFPPSFTASGCVRVWISRNIDVFFHWNETGWMQPHCWGEHAVNVLSGKDMKVLSLHQEYQT